MSDFSDKLVGLADRLDEVPLQHATYRAVKTHYKHSGIVTAMKDYLYKNTAMMQHVMNYKSMMCTSKLVICCMKLAC